MWSVGELLLVHLTFLYYSGIGMNGFIHKSGLISVMSRHVHGAVYSLMFGFHDLPLFLFIFSYLLISCLYLSLCFIRCVAGYADTLQELYSRHVGSCECYFFFFFTVLITDGLSDIPFLCLIF